MDALYNYNRLIKITFTNEETGETFKIDCPARGRKPNIQISGTLLPVDYMSNVEIRIVNLYLENGKTFQSVKVESGYENSMSVAFEGQITNIYDESPGPEKVTVIICTQCKVSKMAGSTIALNLDENFNLKTALNQITKSAGLDAPYIVPEAAGETSASAFTFTGTVQEALHELKGLFPDVIFMFSDKTIKAVKNEISATEVPKVLKFLQTPPQVVGTTIVIKAPWDPTVKPGDVVSVDRVQFKTKGTISVGALLNTYRVNSVEFRFSSVQGTNNMTIQGYYPEAAK